MQADFEREVTDHLAFLRSDVDRVIWADEMTIRRRGDRRTRQRTASTGIAVVAGVGMLGYSAVVGVPTQTIGNPFLAASPSDRSAPSPAQHSGTSTDQVTRPDGTSRSPRLPGSPPDSSSREFPVRTSPAPPGASEPGTDRTSAPGKTTPPETPSPTSTTEPPPASPTGPPVSPDRLLGAAEMPQVNDSATTWTATGDLPDEGVTPVSLCLPGDLASLGAGDTLRRDYTWGSEGTVTGANVIGAFDSADEARSAYETFAQWLDGCSWGTPHGPTEVSLPAGEAGWWWVGHDNGDSSGQIEVVGLVRRARTVSVVVWRQDGQDLVYETDPMAPVLQAAAARLADTAASSGPDADSDADGDD
jgi:hypothetical protein